MDTARKTLLPGGQYLVGIFVKRLIVQVSNLQAVAKQPFANNLQQLPNANTNLHLSRVH